jgi:hypothetical protein
VHCADDQHQHFHVCVWVLVCDDTTSGNLQLHLYNQNNDKGGLSLSFLTEVTISDFFVTVPNQIGTKTQLSMDTAIDMDRLSRDDLLKELKARIRQEEGGSSPPKKQKSIPSKQELKDLGITYAEFISIPVIGYRPVPAIESFAHAVHSCRTQAKSSRVKKHKYDKNNKKAKSFVKAKSRGGVFKNDARNELNVS